MVALDDADLLTSAAAGGADSFAIFFRRHEHAVTRFCVRRCDTPEDVADAVADTFLVALRRSSAYEPTLPTALPWLLGIAQRVVSRQRRGRLRRMRLIRRVEATSPQYSHDESERIAAAIDAARRSDAIRGALESLPRSERAVLELVAYGELAPAEAAAALGISANAARMRLARARRRVRDDTSDLEVVDARA